MRKLLAVCCAAGSLCAACQRSPAEPDPGVETIPADLRIEWREAPVATSSPEVRFDWALTSAGAEIPPATWTCFVDTQPAASCAPPLHLRVIGEGRHALTVSANVIGAARSPAPVTATWWLDTTTPTLVWNIAPPALTTARTLTLAIASSEPGTLRCLLDGTVLSCEPTFTIENLTPGLHELRIELCDLAGNCDALEATFRIDAAPDTELTGCPPEVTSATSASFSLAGVDNGRVSAWRCRLDGGSWFDCDGSVQVSGLGDGEHLFEAASVDDVGLTDPSPATCAWRIDRTPETWLVYRPSPLTPLTTAIITVGSPDSDLDHFVCTLAGNSMVCPATSLWTVAAGAASTVTVTAVDVGGQKDPTTEDTTISWQVVTGAVTTWTDVAVGETHACALRTDGTLWCWGANDSGQLGIASAALSATSEPFAVTAAPTWATVATGHHHSCAIDTNGDLWCWGLNVFGEVGTGPTGTERPPQRLDGAWRRVCANRWHTCAIDVASVAWCWGYNVDGRLGTGDTASHAAPVSIDTGTPWQEISCGGSHTCGLTTSGDVRCWGSNADGQISGDGDALLPRPIALPDTAVGITAGGKHTCARLADASVWCWGDGIAGQLGTASSGTTLPTRYAMAQTWSAVSAGGRHTCALDPSGALYCSGDAQSGAIGFRPLPPIGGLPLAGVTTPTGTGGETPWLRIDAGNTATCGIRAGGTLWCWGQGDLLPSWAGDASFAPVWIRSNP